MRTTKPSREPLRPQPEKEKTKRRELKYSKMFRTYNFEPVFFTCAKSGLDTAATMFLPALEREDLGMLVLAGASALLCFLAGCVVHQSFVLRIILGRIEAIERRVMHVKVTNHRSQSAGSDCGDGQRGVRVQSGCSE